MRSSNSLFPTPGGYLIAAWLLVTALSAIEAHAQPGACCETDGSCNEGTAAACGTGTYQGDGSTCATHCPEPTGTQFTFQGVLSAGDAPLGGTVDLAASLWDAPIDGIQVATTVEYPKIDLDHGLFTLQLDFGGDVFNGDARWLQIGVRHPPGSGLKPISPRQPIRAVPYAIQTRGIFVTQDAGEYYVGIGTTSPVSPLKVEADSANFAVIWAHNTTTSGLLQNGVRAETDSPSGRGLFALAGADNGENYAVWAQTQSPDGYAGHFTGPAGSKNYFERNVGIGTASPEYPLHVEAGSVFGILAHNTFLTGTAVRGVASGAFAAGVRGVADASSGTNVGVWGETNSPNGYAGYFTGPSGSQNYFARSVGIGTLDPDAGARLHVVGNSDVTPSGGGIFVVEKKDSNGSQLAFDNNELQARDSNGATALVINQGGGDVKLVPRGGGNVGIGTTNPNHELVVQGDDPVVQIRDDTVNNSSNAARLELLERGGGNFDGGAFFKWNGATNRLLVGTKVNGVNTNVLVVDRATSSVGIGTQNPGNYRLAVNGPIRAKEIVVETGWSDFVFEPDYDLPSLEQWEAHIREHGHLPDIPSAVEVAKNGVKVGEMQSRLLQKVEELTLHLIDMNKRVQALEQENAHLESRLDDECAMEGGAD